MPFYRFPLFFLSFSHSLSHTKIKITHTVSQQHIHSCPFPRSLPFPLLNTHTHIYTEFLDLAFGANDAAASIAALLIAIQTLGRLPRASLAALPHQITFLFSNADEWAAAGTRRFVSDLMGFECVNPVSGEETRDGLPLCADPVYPSTMFEWIAPSDIAAVIAVDQIGRTSSPYDQGGGADEWTYDGDDDEGASTVVTRLGRKLSSGVKVAAEGAGSDGGDEEGGGADGGVDSSSTMSPPPTPLPTPSSSFLGTDTDTDSSSNSRLYVHAYSSSSCASDALAAVADAFFDAAEEVQGAEVLHSTLTSTQIRRLLVQRSVPTNLKPKPKPKPKVEVEVEAEVQTGTGTRNFQRQRQRRLILGTTP